MGPQVVVFVLQQPVHRAHRLLHSQSAITHSLTLAQSDSLHSLGEPIQRCLCHRSVGSRLGSAVHCTVCLACLALIVHGACCIQCCTLPCLVRCTINAARSAAAYRLAHRIVCCNAGASERSSLLRRLTSVDRCANPLQRVHQCFSANRKQPNTSHRQTVPSLSTIQSAAAVLAGPVPCAHNMQPKAELRALGLQ